MDKNNIINFPKEKLKNPATIQSQEDWLEQITEYKTSLANDFSDMLSANVFNELARSDSEFEKKIDELFPSMVLVSEAIQSLHLKLSGVHHPLQDFAEDVFSDDNIQEMVDNDEKVDYNEIIEDNGDE